MRAGEVENTFVFPHLFDLVGSVENVIDSTADNDVFVESGFGNELRIGLDRKGEFFLRLPMGDHLIKGDIPLEGGMSTSSHSLMIEHRGDGTRKSEVIDPLPGDLIPSDGRHLADLVPDLFGRSGNGNRVLHDPCLVR